MPDLKMREPLTPVPRRFRKADRDLVWALKPAIRFSPVACALANATGLRRAGPYSLRTLIAETRIQLTHVAASYGQPLRLVTSFEHSSPPIKRFVVEALALGIATAVARSHFGAVRTRPIHIDNVPAGVLRPTRGPRPDLAYRLGPSQWIAAEARGRTQRAPRTVSPEQRRRVRDLHRWARQQHRTPKYFAAWSWLTDIETTVDVIDPGEQEQWVNEASMEEYVAAVEANLFRDETLPSTMVRGHALRGLWTDVTPIEPDGARRWLYVGVLDAQFEEVVGRELLDDLVLEWLAEDGEQVAAEATGRVLSVWTSADLEPEPGSLPQALLSRLNSDRGSR